ncbi:MAG: helix-turn-helix domain-containing protein [Chloroflexota bacterium]|nr:helix-turn-helix domain-containing protein [Chloroflexota bacterium]
MGVFGDTLRQARAHKGVTLREAEVATRINRHWLLALEEEHFDQLPALIYQRGIVRNYASYLNLDPAKLLQMFVEARGDCPVVEPAVIAQPQTIATAGSFVPNFAVIAFVVVAMGAMFAWGYSAYFAGNDPESNLPGAVATATQLGDEDRFIPTNTPVPPTNTPIPPTEEPEETEPSRDNDQDRDNEDEEDGDRVQISYPTRTASADDEDVVTLDGGNADEGDESSPDEQSDAGEDSDPSGNTSYNFYAMSDVDLLIVVDNVVVWEMPLPATGVTGYLTGESFVVSVSEPGALVVIDGDGDETIMDATEFTLP